MESTYLIARHLLEELRGDKLTLCTKDNYPRYYGKVNSVLGYKVDATPVLKPMANGAGLEHELLKYISDEYVVMRTVDSEQHRHMIEFEKKKATRDAEAEKVAEEYGTIPKYDWAFYARILPKYAGGDKFLHLSIPYRAIIIQKFKANELNKELFNLLMQINKEEQEEKGEQQ